MKLNKLSMAILAIGFSTLTTTAFAWTTDIAQKGNIAYVKDSDGNIVRDTWGRCVRTIDWTKKRATAVCEGWPVAKPVVAAAPVAKPIAKPAPAVKPQPKPKPVVIVEAPLAFNGFFKTNGSELTEAATAKLDKYVTFMNAHPHETVAITGYTDSRGAASYNKALSQKRADAVKTYLENKGIASNRISATGMGEANPIADNATQAGRAKNRRVELTLTK